MKVAALDLGSNTFLCLIAEVTEKGITNTYSDSVEVVRLGQGLSQSQRFHPEALQRADTCLKKFSDIIKQQQPEKILAMATAAARDAVNKEELFALADKYHIPLEIIPGEKEAVITYQGAVSGFLDNKKNLMVIDIGGGSTEYIFGRGQSLIGGESHNIGCVKLTEKFISAQPTSKEEIKNVIDVVDGHIRQVLQNKPDNFDLEQIVAVAGTPTSLVAAELGHFDPAEIDGYRLTQDKLKGWLEKFQKATVQEKIEMGISAGRADVILVGVIILLRTLVLFGLNELTVSTRGVRYGIALELARRHPADI